MKRLNFTDKCAIDWLLLGGVNRGMRALFERDLLEQMLGADTLLLRAVDLVMFMSALYVVILLFELVKRHISAD
ncbi:MAG TPA: DUF378 domain-containing protein [Candidatus Peribacteraceae bacterium]|nr:DUF378 domain-containing protein [Candidatus Peribacteraceae bacterium]